MVLESALICLSFNIFHEARGESVLGQYAVAQVTMRRAGYDQTRVCEEVYRYRQFSWTRAKHKHPAKIDPDAYVKARAIARVVLTGRMPMDFSRGATHYHAVRVDPYWSSFLIRTARVGAHVFYR